MKHIILLRGGPTHTIGWGSCPSYRQSKTPTLMEFLGQQSRNLKILGKWWQRPSPGIRGWRKNKRKGKRPSWANQQFSGAAQHSNI